MWLQNLTILIWRSWVILPLKLFSLNRGRFLATRNGFQSCWNFGCVFVCSIVLNGCGFISRFGHKLLHTSNICREIGMNAHQMWRPSKLHWMEGAENLRVLVWTSIVWKLMKKQLQCSSKDVDSCLISVFRCPVHHYHDYIDIWAGFTFKLIDTLIATQRCCDCCQP